MMFCAGSKRLNCNWHDVRTPVTLRASYCTKVVGTSNTTKQNQQTAVPVSDWLFKNRNDRRIHAREFNVE